MGRAGYLGVPRVGPGIDPPPHVGPDIDPLLRVPVVVLPPGVSPSVFIVVPVDIDVDINTYVILDEKRVTRGGDKPNEDNRVFAFKYRPAEVWRIRCTELENVYIIEKREKEENPNPPPPFVWTAPSADEAAHPDQILLELLKPDPFQLFKFERVDVE